MRFGSWRKALVVWSIYGRERLNWRSYCHGTNVGIAINNLLHKSVIEKLIEDLEPEDIFYDVGANVGTYTCFAAAKLGPQRTVAFEPEPQNAAGLRENLALNDLDAEILEVSLSNINGTVDFALSGEEAGEGEHAIATDGDEETIEVETARGDSVIESRDLPRPTVVKIDVEGAEVDVLRGMAETLRNDCRLVYVEVHRDKITSFGSTPPDVKTFLEDAGFEVEELMQRGSEVFLRAAK